MSATLESEKYAQYFATRLPRQLHPSPAPVVSVEGKVWPVMDFYLDDLRAFGEVGWGGGRKGKEGGGRR